MVLTINKKMIGKTSHSIRIANQKQTNEKTTLTLRFINLRL